jgi:hypothetical protein
MGLVDRLLIVKGLFDEAGFKEGINAALIANSPVPLQVLTPTTLMTAPS